MTHLKAKLMTTALILACAATPAFANHHEEGTMKKTMEKTETMMRDGETMVKDGEHMMKDGDHMMKGDGMMKSDTSMQTTMTSAQRMDAEKKIISAMSKKERKAYMKMAPDGRKAMMNKKLTGDYMAHSSIMMSDTMTTGEVLQMNEPKNPTMGDGDVLMSDGRTIDADRVMAMESKDSDGMIKNNAIVVPTVNNQAITTVSCPVGTTAQTNGTCLITGNYKY